MTWVNEAVFSLLTAVLPIPLYIIISEALRTRFRQVVR
jgi:hypothetical protein